VGRFFYALAVCELTWVPAKFSEVRGTYRRKKTGPQAGSFGIRRILITAWQLQQRSKQLAKQQQLRQQRSKQQPKRQQRRQPEQQQRQQPEQPG